MGSDGKRRDENGRVIGVTFQELPEDIEEEHSDEDQAWSFLFEHIDKLVAGIETEFDALAFLVGSGAEASVATQK